MHAPTVRLELESGGLELRLDMNALRAWDAATGRNALAADSWDDLRAGDWVALVWATQKAHLAAPYLLAMQPIPDPLPGCLTLDQVGARIHRWNLDDVRLQLQTLWKLSNPERETGGGEAPASDPFAAPGTTFSQSPSSTFDSSPESSGPSPPDSLTVSSSDTSIETDSPSSAEPIPGPSSSGPSDSSSSLPTSSSSARAGRKTPNKKRQRKPRTPSSSPTSTE